MGLEIYATQSMFCNYFDVLWVILRMPCLITKLGSTSIVSQLMNCNYTLYYSMLLEGIPYSCFIILLTWKCSFQVSPDFQVGVLLCPVNEAGNLEVPVAVPSANSQFCHHRYYWSHPKQHLWLAVSLSGMMERSQQLEVCWCASLNKSQRNFTGTFSKIYSLTGIL